MAEKHKWTENDDLAALYVYLFKTDRLPYSVEEVARNRGITFSSFMMRVGNFRALDGKGGLDNFAKQSKKIYNHYHELNERDLRLITFPELQNHIDHQK